MVLVIAGLGNPGNEYERTRHNIGFLIVRALAEQFGVHFRKDSRFEGWRAKVALPHGAVELFLPATFMNESGRAVGKVLRYFGWQPSDLLVVMDDMAIPFGQMRLKAFGGAGGHNGLKSIEKELGSSRYARLRVGIGEAKGRHIDHVLGAYTKEESELLPGVIDRAVDALKRVLSETFERVANTVNQKVQNQKEGQE